MAVKKKKKKATRKKSSKIVKQSNNSNELVEKIKANPLIALIGIAIVVGIGIFIYSSQQSTQIALNNCIDKNLNSKSNSNISDNLIISKCTQKYQKSIPVSSIKIVTSDMNMTKADYKCIEKKLTTAELKKFKKMTKAGKNFYGINFPECKEKKYIGQESSLINTSNYLVTEIEYLSENGKYKVRNTDINPNESWWVEGRVDKIINVQGVKIKLK